MKNFGEGFFIGIRTWFEAWPFIFRNGLSHYFLYPVIISVIIGMGALALIKNQVDRIVALIKPHIIYKALEGDSAWEKFLELLSDIGSYAVAFVLWVIGLYIFHRIKKYIVLILMSPMMSLLSERTDEILTGVVYKFDGKQWVRDIFRGIFLSLRNLVVELSVGLALWIMTIVLTLLTGGVGFMVSWLAAIAGFGISAYFFGFSTLDYSNERKRLSIGSSIRHIRNNKGLAVGNGTMFNLLMWLPMLGATLATVTCTVAATIALHRQDELNKTRQ